MGQRTNLALDRSTPTLDGVGDLPRLDHENLSNTVYSTLCDALIRGQFEPGDRIRLRELAERLGTSVTPVRDAMLRLIQDDAILLRSPRDMRVPVITQDRYLEIRAIRLKLEGLAAERAAQVASHADIDALKDLVLRNEKAIAAGDRLLATELNQAFHFELPRIAKMPILVGTLRRLWLQMGPLIARAYLEGGREMIDYHYPVVEAISRHDPEAASQAIMDDILRGGRVILQQVPEDGSESK